MDMEGNYISIPHNPGTAFKSELLSHTSDSITIKAEKPDIEYAIKYPKFVAVLVHSDKSSGDCSISHSSTD